MFGSKTGTPAFTKKEEHLTSTSEQNTDPKQEVGKSFFASPAAVEDEDSNDERLPSAMRLQCLRCKGTVEGPKFSTCKCAIPALTPDDLGHSHGGAFTMLSGMFSKSSSVAGGLAGGLMKATAVTASSVTGLVSHSTHSNPASSQLVENPKGPASPEDVQ
jgi:hypothetical protein